MDNRIRHAFDQVRAEDTLKKDTEKYLEKATHGYGKHSFFVRRLAVSFAGIAMAFVVAAGSYFYAVPAYAITLDAESSVELRVNRMDRVISVKGVNDNGRTLANSVKVFLMKYPDALETIMSNADIRKDLEEKKDISITVVGENDQKSEEMTDVISSCTYAHHPNITCMCGNREDVEASRKRDCRSGNTGCSWNGSSMIRRSPQKKSAACPCRRSEKSWKRFPETSILPEPA